MARNRYAKDYRLIETWNEKGKLKVSYEYIGDSYHFTADQQTVKSTKTKLLLLCLAGWAGFLVPLFVYASGMHTLYVALPFIFSAVPLTLLTDLTVSFLQMKEPLEHRHADRMNSRFPLAALMTALFPLFALCGQAVNLFMQKPLVSGDYVLMAGGLLLFASGALSFRLREKAAVTLAD